jgi:hypothetical protein
MACDCFTSFLGLSRLQNYDWFLFYRFFGSEEFIGILSERTFQVKKRNGDRVCFSCEKIDMRNGILQNADNKKGYDVTKNSFFNNISGASTLQILNKNHEKNSDPLSKNADK